jgi:anti-sigma B factor antagonist
VETKFRVLKNDEDIYIIEPQGKMDLLSATRMKELVMKLIEQKIESLIINLGKVKSIDSSGIGALINLSSTLRKLNMKLAITNLSGPVKQAVELMSLSGYFPITSDLREALDLIQPENGKT